MPTVPPHVLPSPITSFSRSSGTTLVSSVAVAVPCASIAATVRSETRRSQRAPSRAMPWSSISVINRRRSPGTSAWVHAASITAPSSRSTTNIVRRIPSMRSSVRSS